MIEATHLRYMGMRFISEPLMATFEEDWSGVRSRARAERRRRRGFPQRVRTVSRPMTNVLKMTLGGEEVFVGHPVTIAAVARSVDDRLAAAGQEVARGIDRQAYAALRGHRPA